MRLAIMQPYFFPYIGYFQLMHAVDVFVVYDNIKFTKKGWIRRNRILLNGRARTISLPLKADSDSLHICERKLADSYDKDRQKMLRLIEAAYRKAPYFRPVIELLKDCLGFQDRNLFRFLLYSLLQTRHYLGIKSEVVISSDVPVDHNLRGQDRVIAICKALGAAHYINPIGGVTLYDKAEFAKQDIGLSFLRPGAIQYSQFDSGNFVPNLSIIDVMMFNSPEQIARMLDDYELL